MSNFPFITQLVKVKASVGTEVGQAPKPMMQLKPWDYYLLPLLNTTYLVFVFIL